MPEGLDKVNFGQPGLMLEFAAFSLPKLLQKPIKQ